MEEEDGVEEEEDGVEEEDEVEEQEKEGELLLVWVESIKHNHKSMCRKLSI